MKFFPDIIQSKKQDININCPGGNRVVLFFASFFILFISSCLELTNSLFCLVFSSCSHATSRAKFKCFSCRTYSTNTAKECLIYCQKFCQILFIMDFSFNTEFCKHLILASILRTFVNVDPQIAFIFYGPKERI